VQPRAIAPGQSAETSRVLPPAGTPGRGSPSRSRVSDHSGLTAGPVRPWSGSEASTRSRSKPRPTGLGPGGPGSQPWFSSGDQRGPGDGEKYPLLVANRRHEASVEVPGWRIARRPLFRMNATICATDSLLPYFDSTSPRRCAILPVQKNIRPYANRAARMASPGCALRFISLRTLSLDTSFSTSASTPPPSPNSSAPSRSIPISYHRFAVALTYVGEPARAVEVSEAKIRLDPFQPLLFAFGQKGAAN
jgi:hypothetical protein